MSKNTREIWNKKQWRKYIKNRERREPWQEAQQLTGD